MTHTDDSSSQPRTASLAKRMLIGAGIAFTLISLFLFTADDPDPAWGKFWMIRPLIIVPLAGAVGGACNYFLVNSHYLARMNKTLAIFLSVIIFIIGLWLGTVLGLDGTMWN